MLKRLLFILLLTPFVFKAQHLECGYNHAHNKAFEQNPDFKKNIALQNNTIQNHQNFFKNSETIYTLPIVVHVVHNGEAVGTGNNISDEQIMSGITQLNNAFRNVEGTGNDVKIQFQLAKQDPNCNASTGIVRVNGSGLSGYSTSGLRLQSAGADEISVKALSKWPNENYYNIWIVSEIDGNGGGSGFQGFAYFPGVGSNKDGMVVQNTAWGNMGTVNSWNNQGKTIIHEMGHALGLYHSFEGDNNGNSCPATTNGCGTGQGDCCDDTPIHIRSASDCKTGTNSCTGNAYGDEIHNYMDYSSQDCQYLFTKDQVARMRSTLETQRAQLINGTTLNEPIAFANTAAVSCTPTTGGLGLSNYYCGILNVGLNGKNFPSDYSNVDNGYVDNTTSCSNVIELEEGNSYSLNVKVGVNNNFVKAWIDYNDDGTFDPNTESILETTIESQGEANVQFTIPGGAVTDKHLRLRVMADLANFNGPCANPTYGQAEDYSVYIHSSPVPGFPVVDFSANKNDVTINETINLTDLTGNANTWSWTITGPESMNSTTQNPNFTFTKAGTYSVKLVATNNNGSDSEEKFAYIVVRNVTSNQEVNSKIETLKAFPNPVVDQVTITSDFEIKSLRILDMQGKIVQNQVVLTTNQANKININFPFSKGSYIVQAIGDQTSAQIPIIKR